MDELNYQRQAMKTFIQKPFKAACPSLHLLCIALMLLNLVAVPASPAAFRYQVLKSFGSVTNDGQGPQTGLLEGSDGALYGVTPVGGAFTNAFGDGPGTIFKLDKDGSGYTILHHLGAFAGWYPSGRLLEGINGALYGVAQSRGGLGDVFKLNKDGSGFGVLGSAGVLPVGKLVEGTFGGLYGMNSFGLFWLFGTFGTEVRWYSFSNPDSVLLEGTDRALYFVTQPGAGEKCSPSGVFKTRQDAFGSVQTLHSFCSNGGSGVGIIEGDDGRLYGIGPGGEDSAVFSLNKDGTDFRYLHYFAGNDDPGGAAPLGTLVQGKDRALYGTTYRGGSNGFGTVFMLNKDGSGYRLLHHFGSVPGDGTLPMAGLIQGDDSAFYGTTTEGGEFGFGTVFKLWRPRLLPPAVSNGVATLRIMDGPGFTNELQRATALDGNWQTLTNLVVPPGGVAEFTDTAPPMPGAFYRSIGR